MEVPSGVIQAVAAIWATIVISSLGAVLAARLNQTSQVELMTALFVYALFCIIPYKVCNRSNSARYVYLVISCMSVLMMLAGVSTVSRVDLISSVIQLPLMIFALFKLFETQASKWFTSKN